ncbi:MAG TPA: PAS domain S-box protein [Terriglobales bacterium]|nr:PAS domain S-box protein [Terriglobales bacterium]
MSEENKADSTSRRTPGHLEREESQLWRWALMFLVLLATGLAALAWDRLQDFPYHLGAIPVGLVILSILFAVYVYGRRREVSELKSLLHDLEERSGAAPSPEQLDQLSQVISRSQKSFKELIDSLEDAAFALSLDGTLRTVNRSVSELLHLPYTEIVGRKLDEFVEEPSRAQIQASLGRFLEKRHWAGLANVRLKSSTRILYFDCTLNAIVKDDEVVGTSVLARDVTSEREKETRFTELFETLQEGIYFSSPEGKLLDANSALVTMLGYETKEEILSLLPEQMSFHGAQAAPLGNAGKSPSGVRQREITLRRKDGSAAIFMDTSRAILDGYGNVIRYQGTLVDVTQRRSIEKKLREQEQFQRYLLESFPDLILVIGLDESYQFVSSRIRDVLGGKPDDLLGKKVTDTEQAPELIALCREILAGRMTFGACEYGIRHSDGSWRMMRASVSALHDAERVLSGAIASIRDITIERKFEAQVIESERLAAMGQMIGGFAHELNNPLTSILGMADLLQDTASDDTRKQLATLQQEARRAAEVVQNLLYFSRPPAPGRNPIDPGELIERTIHLHTYSLRKNNITVDFLREPVRLVSGDAHQLMQIFLNLVRNAEQAIRETRERGTLRIRCSNNGQTVSIAFQDDGAGISAEVLPYIFDPFYTTKRPGRGTGLGLSICKAILREHGGNIEAAPAPGGGAVFTVTLPAMKAHSSHA